MLSLHFTKTAQAKGPLQACRIVTASYHHCFAIVSEMAKAQFDGLVKLLAVETANFIRERRNQNTERKMVIFNGSTRTGQQHLTCSQANLNRSTMFTYSI